LRQIGAREGSGLLAGVKHELAGSCLPPSGGTSKGQSHVLRGG